MSDPDSPTLVGPVAIDDRGDPIHVLGANPADDRDIAAAELLMITRRNLGSALRRTGATLTDLVADMRSAGENGDIRRVTDLALNLARFAATSGQTIRDNAEYLNECRRDWAKVAARVGVRCEGQPAEMPQELADLLPPADQPPPLSAQQAERQARIDERRAVHRELLAMKPSMRVHEAAAEVLTNCTHLTS